MKIDRSSYYITIFFVLLGILPQALTAQSGQNPFDIDGNAPVQPITKEELSPAPTTIPNPNPSNTDTSTTTSSDNPFETTTTKDSATPVLEETPIRVDPSNLTTNPFEVAEGDANTEIPPLPTTDIKSKPTEEAPPTITTSDAPISSGILFILVVIMLVLFALMVTFFRPFFGRVYQAFLSDNQLGSAYREMGSTISPPYLFLYAMFLINASILVYVILNYYGLSFYDGWLSILAILGTLCAVYLGKHLLLFIIKSIFPVAKEMDLYNFTIIIFNIVLGVLFIPFSLLIAYGPENLTLTIVYFSFFAIFLVYAYRIVRSLLIGGKYLSFSKFHFFMYLCTAEVAPLLIVIKYFLKHLD